MFLGKPLLVIPVVLYAFGEGATGSTRGLNLPPKVYAGAFVFVDSLMFGSKKKKFIIFPEIIFYFSLPKRVGRVIAAGPGPANSAAIGPLLFKQ